MLVAGVLVLSMAGGALRGPIRYDIFSIRPPEAFHKARMDLFHGSRVGAVTIDSSAERFLGAALTDGDGDDAASMLFGVVNASLSVDTGARDVMSTAVVRHFRDELDLKFNLERADVVPSPNGPRVEVLGSVRDGSQLRQIVVAAFPSENRYAVVTFSVPSGRWDVVRADIRDSLDSFRIEGPNPSGRSRRLAILFAAVVAMLLVASWSAWRRKVRGAEEAP